MSKEVTLLGFRGQGSGVGIYVLDENGKETRRAGFGSVSGLVYGVWGLGPGVWCLVFRVWGCGVGDWVWGWGCRV